PERGVDLTYFLDEHGFARQMAPMPGDGATWIDGLIVLSDEAGNERMFASYVKVRPPMDIYARGLALYDPAIDRFRHAADFKMDAPAYPGGHPFIHKDGGVDYVYFAKSNPLTRVRAKPEALQDLAQYETYTCLKQGSRLERPQVERGPDGS